LILGLRRIAGSRSALVGCLSLLWLACSSDGAAGPTGEGSFEGTYQLESIDGDQVPSFLSSETPREEIFDEELGCELWATAGSVTFHADNRYSRSETEADLDCDDPADDDSRTFDNTGTWTRDGNTVMLVENRQIFTLTADGTWNGDVVSLTFRETDLLGDVEITQRVYRR